MLTALCLSFGLVVDCHRDNALLPVTFPPWVLILFTRNKKGPYEIPGSQLRLQLESHKKLEEKKKEKQLLGPHSR